MSENGLIVPANPQAALALVHSDPVNFAALRVFPAYDPNSMQARALAANTAGMNLTAADLTTIKTPSGGGRFWEVDGASGIESLPEIEGVFVYFAVQGTLWATQGLGTGDRPILSTRDLITARLVRPDTEVTRNEQGKIIAIEGVDQDMALKLGELEIVQGGQSTWLWQQLPWTQFGSGRGGKGKFAKEGMLLFVLTKKHPLPYVIKTGSSAIKPIRQWLLKLNTPYWHTVVGISLKQEQTKAADEAGRIVDVKYSVPVISLKSTLSPIEGNAVENTIHAQMRASWNSGSIDSADIAE
jgi:hypothetical protein